MWVIIVLYHSACVMCHCEKLLDCLIIFMLKGFLCIVVWLAIFMLSSHFFFFLFVQVSYMWTGITDTSVFFNLPTHTHGSFSRNIRLYFVKVGEPCTVRWLWSSWQIMLFYLQQNNNHSLWDHSSIMLFCKPCETH